MTAIGSKHLKLVSRINRNNVPTSQVVAISMICVRSSSYEVIKKTGHSLRPNDVIIKVKHLF